MTTNVKSYGGGGLLPPAFAQFAGGVLLALLASGHASAVSLTSDLSFASTDQSLWGPGDAVKWALSETLARGNWNLSGTIGGVSQTFLGRYGAELSAHTSGSFGLGIQANFDSGSVNAVVPMSVSLTVPESYTINPGEHFTLTSGSGLGLGASLTSMSPSGGFRLFGDLAVEADVGGRVCFVGCASGSATLINANVQKDLVNISSADLKFDIGGKYGSIHGEFPELALKGGVEGGAIHASGRDNFLTASADIASILSVAAGLPPLSGSVSLGIGTLSYTLLSSLLTASAAITEDLTLQPTLMIDLAFSTGEHKIFAAGDTVDLVMPAEGVTFTPTYFLRATLSNRIGVLGQADLDLSALSVGFSRIGTLGPLFHKDIGLGSIGATVFNRDWEMGGFKTITGSSISIAPVPEPVSFVLIGSGLLVIGSILKKRHHLAAV